MFRLAEKRLSREAKEMYDGWELVYYGGKYLVFKHVATSLNVHLSCEGYPFTIPKIKYSIDIFLDCTFTLGQWSPANTIGDILAWINPTYGPVDIFALIDEEKLNKLNVQFAGLSIDPIVAKHPVLTQIIKDVLIRNKTELIMKQSIIAATMKKSEISSVDTKSGLSVMTVHESPTRLISSAERWLISSSKKLKEQINMVATKCELKFNVTSVAVLHNQKLFNAFLKHPGYETNSRLLFRGMRYRQLTSFFEKGFLPIDQSSRNDGWYGIGHYFTSFPQYAIHNISYSDIPSDVRTYYLVVCHVNVGKVKTIKTMEYGKRIPTEYDCNYIQVGLEGPNGLPWDPSEHNPPIYDEYAIPDFTRILPRYLITVNVTSKR